MSNQNNRMGPTPVAKRTMPSRTLLDRKEPFKYTPSVATDIRELFNRVKK